MNDNDPQPLIVLLILVTWALGILLLVMVS
jgi:hypothetical protein